MGALQIVIISALWASKAVFALVDYPVLHVDAAII
jgi:hypothetical protein